MPAIKSYRQRRYDVSSDGPDFEHMAIILGCLGVVLIFICILAFFIRLRSKSTGNLTTGVVLIEGHRGNEAIDRREPPSKVTGGPLQVVDEVQESGEPPKYQAAEPTYQQHDLPPAYESTEVWSNSNARASRLRTNWTSTWLFRSTTSG